MLITHLSKNLTLNLLVLTSVNQRGCKEFVEALNDKSKENKEDGRLGSLHFIEPSQPHSPILMKL